MGRPNIVEEFIQQARLYLDMGGNMPDEDERLIQFLAYVEQLEAENVDWSKLLEAVRIKDKQIEQLEIHMRHLNAVNRVLERHQSSDFYRPDIYNNYLKDVAEQEAKMSRAEESE